MTVANSHAVLQYRRWTRGLVATALVGGISALALTAYSMMLAMIVITFTLGIFVGLFIGTYMPKDGAAG